MYIFIIHIIRIYTYIYTMYFHIYVWLCVYVCVYVYMCVCMCVCMCVWHISLMLDVLKLLTRQVPYHVSTISYHHQGMPCRWNPPCRTSKLRASPCRKRLGKLEITGTSMLSLNFWSNRYAMVCYFIPILKSYAFCLSTQFRLWGWLRIWFLHQCSYW